MDRRIEDSLDIDHAEGGGVLIVAKKKRRDKNGRDEKDEGEISVLIY